MAFSLLFALLVSMVPGAQAVGVGVSCTTDSDCTSTNTQSNCYRAFTTDSCSNGICACNAGYSGNSCTATAVTQGYNGACSSNANCSTGFACTNNLCKCATSTYTYRTIVSMCLAPAVKVYDESCTQTSECYNTGGASNAMECSTTSNKCACVSGYLQMSGLCQLPYIGQSCSGSPGCRQWTTPLITSTDTSRVTETCQSSKCECPSSAEEHSYVNDGTTYRVCLETYSGNLLADGATCTSSKMCTSKICHSCDGTATKSCVRIQTSGATSLHGPIAVLLAALFSLVVKLC